MAIRGQNGIQNSAGNGNLANNSGGGKGSAVLDIVAKRFNWGAFLLSWIWGLGNRTYITLVIFPAFLLCLIPILGPLAHLCIYIWFGIKGNTWAWQNKRWQSVEEFHRVQKKWAIAGVIVILLSLIAGIILSTFIAALSLNMQLS